MKYLIIGITLISFILCQWLFGFLSLAIEIMLPTIASSWIEYALLILAMIISITVFYLLISRKSSYTILGISTMIVIILGVSNYYLSDYYSSIMLNNMEAVGMDRIANFTGWHSMLKSPGMLILLMLMVLLKSFRSSNDSKTKIIDQEL